MPNINKVTYLRVPLATYPPCCFPAEMLEATESHREFPTTEGFAILDTAATA